MVLQHLTIFLTLAMFLDSTISYSLATQFDLEKSTIPIFNQDSITFLSQGVQFKQNLNSQHNSTKHTLESSRNKTAEQKEDENKINQIDTKFQSKLSSTEDLVIGVVLLLFGTLSLLGNSSTFLLFYSQNKPLSPVEVLIIHLALLDVLLTLFSYPLYIVATFKHGWQFGEIGCTVYAFICEFFRVASVFDITLIAVFRYFKTCRLSVGIQITCLTSFKAIEWSTVMSLLWAVIPLVGVGKYDTEPFGLTCAVNWIARDAVGRFHIVIDAVFGVCLPLFKILVCYIRIIRTVNRSTVQLQTRHFRRRNSKSTGKQLICIGILVGLAFALTRIPITMVMLLSSFRGELVLPMWILPIPVLLAKSAAALNPFIYVFCTKRYRLRLSRIVAEWICLVSKNVEQQSTTFDKTDTTNNIKLNSDRVVNGSYGIEMHIGSYETAEIYQELRTCDYMNEAGCSV